MLVYDVRGILFSLNIALLICVLWQMVIEIGKIMRVFYVENTRYKIAWLKYLEETKVKR
jgi:hypothetical protein